MLLKPVPVVPICAEREAEGKRQTQRSKQGCNAFVFDEEINQQERTGPDGEDEKRKDDGKVEGRHEALDDQLC